MIEAADGGLGTIDAAFIARFVSVDQQRIDDAFRAAKPNRAACGVRGLVLLDLAPMQHVEGHRDDVRFEAGHARTDVSLQ